MKTRSFDRHVDEAIDLAMSYRVAEVVDIRDFKRRTETN